MILTHRTPQGDAYHQHAAQVAATKQRRAQGLIPAAPEKGFTQRAISFAPPEAYGGKAPEVASFAGALPARSALKSNRNLAAIAPAPAVEVADEEPGAAADGGQHSQHHLRPVAQTVLLGVRVSASGEPIPDEAAATADGEVQGEGEGEHSQHHLRPVAQTVLLGVKISSTGEPEGALEGAAEGQTPAEEAAAAEGGGEHSTHHLKPVAQTVLLGVKLSSTGEPEGEAAPAEEAAAEEPKEE